MAWRVIDTDGEIWNVQAAAERRADTHLWQLSVSFRAKNSHSGRGAIWARYPLESGSKSTLFQAADRITDDALNDLLVQQIS
jgi:hypothetical protein